MIKLLFNLFKKQFIRLAFNSQSKPVDKTMLAWSFIDSEGNRYYRWVDDFDIPIIRKGHIQKCLSELECGISLEFLSLVISKIEEALTRTVKGQMRPDIAMIGHLCAEVKNRQQYLFPGDILFDLVAAVYVREDENPADMDMDLHKRKAEQFKKDSKAGLKDFFYNAGLKKYLPYLEKHTEESMLIQMQTEQMETKSLTEQMSRYGLESTLESN